MPGFIKSQVQMPTYPSEHESGKDEVALTYEAHAATKDEHAI